MANDIDMWNDILELENTGEKEKADFLLRCFNAKYNEGDIEKSENLKDEFTKKYGDKIGY